MNRPLLLFTAPYLPLVVGLVAVSATQGVGGPAPLILYPVATMLSLALGLLVGAIPIKKNILAGGLGFYVLGAFNLVMVTAIVVEVLSLFVLLNWLKDIYLSPNLVWLIWWLATFLIGLQTLIILERRINSPAPAVRPATLALVGVVSLFNVVLWTNALLIEHTTFLFLTDLRLDPRQAVYLVLTGATLQAVVAMILFRIPTLFELIFFRPQGRGRILAMTSASPIIFTVAFTTIVFLGSLAFVFLADRVFGLGSVLPQSFGLRLLLVFPVSLVTFFLVAGFLSYQRSRSKFRHRMDVQQKASIALGVGSGIATLFLLYLAWRLGNGETVSISGVRIEPPFWVEALVAALLMATGPIGFYIRAQKRRIWFIEQWLSDFLRDLAETSKAGLPLHQGLHGAAEKDYGPLTSEIRKMSLQCSWGLSFAEAFRRFGQRTNSRLVQRVANLVVETSVSGGNTGDVLSAAAADIHNQKSLEEDRHLAMSTYIAVIYIVFFVFIAVLGVLSVMFLPQLLSATQSATEAGASTALFSSSRINLRSVQDAYFQALLVQAIGNGMIAGLIRDGAPSSGLRHVFILVIISYGAYRVLFA